MSTPTSLWSGSDVHLCEPGVVRSPAGREPAMLLRENRRRAGSMGTVEPFALDGAIVSIQLRALPDGKVDTLVTVNSR